MSGELSSTDRFNATHSWKSGAKLFVTTVMRAMTLLLAISSLRVCPEVHIGLHSFISMRRIEARRKEASALRLRFSQSLPGLRQRSSQAIVRSTINRLKYNLYA